MDARFCDVGNVLPEEDRSIVQAIAITACIQLIEGTMYAESEHDPRILLRIDRQTITRVRRFCSPPTETSLDEPAWRLPLTANDLTGTPWKPPRTLIELDDGEVEELSRCAQAFLVYCSSCRQGVAENKPERGRWVQMQ